MAIVKLLKNVKPDGAILVTTPQEVAVATIKKEISFCRKMGVAVLGLVENMSGLVCPCCKVSNQSKNARQFLFYYTIPPKANSRSLFLLPSREP